MGYSLNPEDEPPAPSRALLTDCLGALVTCEGALAGLLRREQTGRGRRVDASLLAGGMTLQAHVLDALSEERERSRRQGRPVWGPLDHPLPTADGFIAVDAAEEGALRRLCHLCGVDAGDSRLECETAVAERIGRDPSSRWEEALCEAGIPCAAVCMDLARLPDNPDLAPLFEPLDGTCRGPAAPWRFSP
jgi:crotonobetainyl-CoA:carnitine CoA-transferase CaiB-like acyl-CoA transferase